MRTQNEGHLEGWERVKGGRRGRRKGGRWRGIGDEGEGWRTPYTRASLLADISQVLGLT